MVDAIEIKIYFLAHCRTLSLVIGQRKQNISRKIQGATKRKSISARAHSSSSSEVCFPV